MKDDKLIGKVEGQRKLIGKNGHASMVTMDWIGYNLLLIKSTHITLLLTIRKP